MVGNPGGDGSRGFAGPVMAHSGVFRAFVCTGWEERCPSVLVRISTAYITTVERSIDIAL